MFPKNFNIELTVNQIRAAKGSSIFQEFKQPAIEKGATQNGNG